MSESEQSIFDKSLDDSPVIQAMHKRLADFESNLLENTKATQAIAKNTAGLVELYTDLAAGTKALCRCALAIKWFLDIIEANYKRLIILGILIWAITHNFHVPDWVFHYTRILGV